MRQELLARVIITLLNLSSESPSQENNPLESVDKNIENTIRISCTIMQYYSKMVVYGNGN